MKKLTFVTVALAALLLGSCVENSEKYKTVVVEKETLTTANAQLQAENENYQATLNAIANSLQAIYDAEGMMMVQSESGDVNYQERLIQLKEVLADNHARLDSLTEVLEKSNKKNANLVAQIKNLKAQVAEKEEVIAGLQAQVAEQSEQIAGLNTEVASLNNNLNNANTEIANLTKQNENQVNEMNTVYYVGGTKKELKNKGIILNLKNILKSEIPTEEFTKADKRNLNSIVFNTKKAVVLSNHPTDSYNLVKGTDENGKKIVTLEITNPEAFWNVTRYLVVLTK